jgi:hypothetical protein
MRAQNQVEVLIGDLPEDRVPEDAGVCDHRVEATELVVRCGDQRFGDGGVTDRGHVSGVAPASLEDCLARFVGSVAVDVVHHDCRAGRGQSGRVGAATRPFFAVE